MAVEWIARQMSAGIQAILDSDTYANGAGTSIGAVMDPPRIASEEIGFGLGLDLWRRFELAPHGGTSTSTWRPLAWTNPRLVLRTCTGAQRLHKQRSFVATCRLSC